MLDEKHGLGRRFGTALVFQFCINVCKQKFADMTDTYKFISGISPVCLTGG